MITLRKHELIWESRYWSMFNVCWSHQWWRLQNSLVPCFVLNFDCLVSCLEKAVAPHSSTLAWKIPWMEEPGELQSMGSLGVGHDWVTSLYFLLSCIGEGNGNPLQCSCLENPRNGGAWWAAICGVAQSRTQLKWLSSSSSSRNLLRVLPLCMALPNSWCSHLEYL